MRPPPLALRCISRPCIHASQRLIPADRLSPCKALHTVIKPPSNKAFPIPPAVPRDPTTAKDASTPSPDLRDTVRHSMRLVTLPVAIITIPREQHEEEELGSPGGLTVSSFNTVSLDAPGGPIVSFNLKLPSQTYEAIQAAGAFNVSLPWAREIVDTFATPEARDDLNAKEVRERIDKEAVFTYQCKWLKELSPMVADHVVMLGQVEGFLHHDAVESTWDGKVVRNWKMPLFYRAAKPIPEK